MKTRNKKGFTIVELVIVIAVIAILAAVLIPTFAGIVKKANESADTQLVRDLNTALATYTAENGVPKDFETVLAALEEAGYVLANLNAKAEGNLYVWDTLNNKIIYVDKDFNAIYPSDADTSNKANFAVVIANAEEGTNLPAGVEILDMTAPVSPNFLKGSLSIGGNVTVGADITVTNEAANAANIITEDATVNFGDKTIKLDIPDATRATLNWVGVRVNGGEVVLDGTEGGIVTADNGELYAMVIGAGVDEYSSAGNVTIKGGKYIGGATAVQVTKGTLTIEGGYFEAQTKDEANSRYMVINCKDATYNNGTAKIFVKGGTFVNFNPANNTCEGAGTNYVVDGYKVVSQTQENNDVWYQVIANDAAIPEGWAEVVAE